MGASQNISFLNCELRIIRAKNVDFISSGNLFIRYYLCAENNKRIRLNSQEIPSSFDPYWNESVSLECFGAEDSMEKLKEQSVVIELRWRNTTPIIRKISRSKLLGRAEISWKDVLDSSELFIEKWVTTASMGSRVLEGLKPPAVQVGMNVRIPRTEEMARRGGDVRSSKWSECGCRHGGCNGRDEDMFALAAVQVL